MKLNLADERELVVFAETIVEAGTLENGYEQLSYGGTFKLTAVDSAIGAESTPLQVKHNDGSLRVIAKNWNGCSVAMKKAMVFWGVAHGAEGDWDKEGYEYADECALKLLVNHGVKFNEKEFLKEYIDIMSTNHDFNEARVERFVEFFTGFMKNFGNK